MAQMIIRYVTEDEHGVGYSHSVPADPHLTEAELLKKSAEFWGVEMVRIRQEKVVDVGGGR